MEISSLGNAYIQDEKPFEKENKESGRAYVITGVATNFIRLLSVLFEPFLPSLSAKTNFLLGFENRVAKDETLLNDIVVSSD